MFSTAHSNAFPFVSAWGSDITMINSLRSTVRKCTRHIILYTKHILKVGPTGVETGDWESQRIGLERCGPFTRAYDCVCISSDFLRLDVIIRDAELVYMD